MVRDQISVRGSGKSWAAYRGNEQVSRDYTCIERAEAAADRAEAALKAKTRHCICCQRKFLSTHAGHRMCDPCRQDPMRSR